MLQDEVYYGAAVVVWSEIGRPSTTASLSVALAAACDGAVLQTVMNMEMVMTG